MTQEISQKTILPAFLFCTFLGGLGIHRFYVGKIGSAIAQLILTLTIIGSIVTIIWVLVDWIMILSGSFRDAEGLKLTKWVN